MICKACQDRRHQTCRGGSWCDCQHRPPPEPGPDQAEDTEPTVNWIRQG